MALPEEQKPSVEQVLKLYDLLTPEEQLRLRQTFIEDQDDIRIALERLKNPGKIWTLEELEKGLDLAG